MIYGGSLMSRRLLGILMIIGLSTAAEDAAGHPCIQPQWKTLFGGVSKIVVDVWMNNSSSIGLPNRLGISTVMAEEAVRRAISIWNEESGAAFLMKYRGTTTNSTVSGATVVKSSSSDCAPGEDDTYVYSETIVWPSNDKILFSELVVFKRVGVDGQCTDLIPWQTAEAGPNDLIAILVHELGHTNGFLHPGDGNCVDNGQLTVMRGGGIGEERRVIREWDRHRLFNAHTNRSAYSLLTRKEWNGTGWINEQSAAKGTLVRPGSLSQKWPWTGLAWYSRSPRGFVKELFYNGSFNNSQSLSPGQGLHQETPSSFAVDPVTGRSIVVYQRQDPFTAQYTPGSDFNYVCYRLSPDGGQTLSSETCIAAGNRGYGVAAAYDPRSDKFVIAYNRDDVPQLSGDDHNIYVITLPKTGGSWVGTSLGNESHFAPSVACRNATTNNCRLAYANASSGSLYWLEMEINASTGAVTPIVTRTQPGGSWYLYDAPSIVWHEVDQTFRLAFRQGNGALYARSMSATGTSWVGMPDIYNASAGKVSSPTLSTEYSCFGGCSGVLRAWWIEWWGD